MYYHIGPYMTMYNCSTHAVMNKFCGSKWTKWFKKAKKKCAVLKLYLRNLTHLCTNFVFV